VCVCVCVCARVRVQVCRECVCLCVLALTVCDGCAGLCVGGWGLQGGRVFVCPGVRVSVSACESARLCHVTWAMGVSVCALVGGP